MPETTGTPEQPDPEDPNPETPDPETPDPETPDPEQPTAQPDPDPEPAKPGPNYGCLTNECTVDKCLEQPDCATTLDCMGHCDSYDCAMECREKAAPPFKGVINDVIDCGVAVDCLSGGPPPPTPQEAYQCIAGSCGIGNCGNWQPCAAAVQCMASCKTKDCTVKCIDNAPGQVKGFLATLVGCAVENGCVPKSAGPQCGDDLCELGESMLTCSDDCGEPSPGYACIAEKCEGGQCMVYESCNAALMCIGDCKDSACTAKCISDGPGQATEYLADIAVCAVDGGCIPEAAKPQPAECGNGVCDVGESLFDCFQDCKPGDEACGNGVCDPGESIEGCGQDCNPDGASCSGSCNQAIDGGPCHCDGACVEFGNCCGDYVSVCKGDGKPAWQCLIDECEATGCANANKCSEALSCIAKCGDEDCAAACMEGQPEQNIPYLEAYIECGFSAGCIEEEPIEPVDPVEPPICINNECSTQLGECTTDFECTKAFQCVGECNDDAACAQACGDDLPEGSDALFSAVLACAADNKCYAD